MNVIQGNKEKYNITATLTQCVNYELLSRYICKSFLMFSGNLKCLILRKPFNCSKCGTVIVFITKTRINLIKLTKLSHLRFNVEHLKFVID